MKASLFFTLYKLAEMDVLDRKTPVTTSYLAKCLGTSQQTASRRLMQLEKNKLIGRTKVPRGIGIHLTRDGKQKLVATYMTLKRIVEPSEFILKGELFSGLGEGAYYIHQPGYRKQFIRKLGHDPFPGTLNVKLQTHFSQEKSLLESIPFITIDGFRNEKRSFGSVRCYPVSVNGLKNAYIITALRSHYEEDILEIIAPVNLRKKLKLKDGDIVTIKVFPSS